MRHSLPPSITSRLTGAVLLALALVIPGEASMSKGFNRLLQAVVRIDVKELEFSEGAKHIAEGVGSGVIISTDGLILTNAHVVSPQAIRVSVTLASLETVSARLVGWDHWTDLALLRIDLDEVKRRGLGFSTADFGSSDELPVGDTVYAVGTPFGLTRTVTRGIISNNNRYFEDSLAVDGYETGAFNTWLQTDAAINPGNSGGPLVTEDGKVIGINARAYIGSDNLGFAIPASVARRVAAELVKKGEITRSYLGLRLQRLQDFETFYSLATNTGVLVNGVDLGSPAARAGLRATDVILTLNGAKVDGRFPEQLPPIQQAIASLPLGSKVTVTVKRASQTMDFSMVTERLESQVGEEWAFEKWGLTVRKVSRAYAREHQLTDETGVLVLGVQPGYPAAEAGLASGDLVTKVGSAPIMTLDQLKDIYSAYEAKPEANLVEAQRDHRISLYVIKP